MTDDYANRSWLGDNSTASPGSSATKSSWQERAREGLNKTVEFLAEHGVAVGIAGGSVLMAMGATATAMTVTADTMIEASIAREAAASLLTAGVLKLAAFSGAEYAAKLHLKGVEYLFDDEAYREAAYGTDGEPIYDDPRSSNPIRSMSDEAVLAEPVFQSAIRSIFKDLEHDPETRHQIYAMIQNNPGAREALMNAQQQIDQQATNDQKPGLVDDIDYSDLDLPDDSPS
ncbi:hypothetical protein [Marinobacter gelidimuriae]|jgi:hypothetical protein|uniref:hypothetical protein n=1 Tax=Marinobacter gelidimuriae TaxID=2739064 RepID=UPI00037E99CC|nr:hypothetical protein [Marinobacter gelidimuriae]